MALITWSEKYSVKNSTIDEQHKKLIGILNDFHDSMMAGKSNEMVEEILMRLIDYTKMHFGTEEKLMEKYAYPDKRAHEIQHIELVNEVGVYYNKLKQGKKFVNLELADFLKNWLNHHIMETDVKFGKFLFDKGEK